MPIDAVKIPQNVQIEDKVVGPLSLRQIIIMAIGGGFSYMLYAMVQRTYGHVSIPITVVVWLPAVIAAAFAVVNINDLSLLRICFLFLERMQKPGRRTWAPRTGISITIRTSMKKETEEKVVDANHQTAEQQIRELSTVVDRPTTPVSTIPAPTISAAPTPAPIAAAPIAASPVPDLPAAALAEAGPEPEKTIPPVRQSDISIDSPTATTSHMSDLSAFRDIFPPTTTWPT